jgi:hypothetical protein
MLGVVVVALLLLVPLEQVQQAVTEEMVQPHQSAAVV